MGTAIDTFGILNTGSTGTTGTGASGNKYEAGSAERFLKLLVTQMQNQDPLNPMENAEITSQMAQINTVTGIEKLNTTVAGLNSQFRQMQALQGAALVGHDVTVKGNAVSFDDSGNGVGGFELAGTADRVKVEVLDGSGRVVDTLQLGALDAGLHGFDWKPAEGTAAGGNYTFRVTANAGTTVVPTTALMRDRVEAVSLDGDSLKLELARSGSVDYDAVRAFN
jgi:flagellar basal-body rod modification protein FlgD